ncbi:MAG: putative bifunctional diguanylate cyclase/phosphodiesterase [Pseudomonadales bacterium]
MNTAITSPMLFLDSAGFANDDSAKGSLRSQIDHVYVESLELALEHMVHHRPAFVLISADAVTEELSEHCAKLETACAAGTTYIVLLLPESVAATSNLLLPGVVGFASIQNSWGATVKQLTFIAGAASRLQRMEVDARRLRLTHEALGLLQCSVDLGSGQCIAQPALINALDLDRLGVTGSAFHWQRLLDRFSPVDRGTLERFLCGGSVANQGKNWRTVCSTVDGAQCYEISGVVDQQSVSSIKSLQLCFRRLSEKSQAVPAAAKEQDSIAVLERHVRDHALGGLLLVRIANFTALKDAFGPSQVHLIADEALKGIAEIIRACDVVALAHKRHADIVPIVGEEALVILDGVQDTDLLLDIRQRIERALAQPVTFEGRQIPLRVTIGHASWPGNGCNAADLLRHAALSLRDSASVSDQPSQVLNQARKAVRLEADLYDALPNNELQLHYQPKFSLATPSRVVGAEALLRWHRRGEEWVQPDQFIPIAEANGLILNFGRWVIEEAVRAQARLQNLNLGLVPVSVNVSAEQFLQPDFVDHLVETCSAAGIPAQALEIEITESCLIEQPERVVLVLSELKNVGFRLALDDFGTGFSSLSYLRTLPIDTLKIDRSFIGALDGDAFDPALTAGIIGIGLALGLRIVAEGIETEVQWDLLQGWGCHQGQGFLMARPMPEPELARFLSKHEQQAG